MPDISLPDGRVISVPDDISPEDEAKLKAKLRADFGPGSAWEKQQQQQPAQQRKMPKRDFKSDISLGDYASILNPAQAGRNFGKFAQKLAVSDNKGAMVGKVAGDIAKDLEGGIRSATGGIGGDQIAGASFYGFNKLGHLLGLGNEDMSLGESIAMQRDQRRQYQEQNAMKGGAAGLVGEIGGVSAVARRAPKFLKNALGFQKRQGLKNAGRAAVMGAAESGGTAALRGDDVSVNTAIGAVGGPVIGGIGRGAGATWNAVRGLANKNKNAGLKAVTDSIVENAKAKGIKPEEMYDEIRARYNTLKAQRGGEDVKLMEVLGEYVSEDAMLALGRSNKAMTQVQKAFDATQQQAVDRAGSSILGDTVSPTSKQVENRAKKMYSDFVAKNKTAQVPLDEKTANAILDNKELYSAINKQIDDTDLLPDMRANRPQAMSPEDLERAKVFGQEVPPEALVTNFGDLVKIRTAMAAQKTDNGGQRFAKELAMLDEAIANAVPEFPIMAQKFGRSKDVAKGITQGKKAVRGDTDDVLADVDLISPGEKVGRRYGSRAELGNKLGEDISTNYKTMERLVESPGVRARADVLDPNKAAGIRERAANELDAARSAAQARRLQLRSANKKAGEAAETLLDLSAAQLAGAGGAFQANIVERQLMRWRVPPAAAEKLADALTSADPQKTMEAIEQLQKLGIEPSEVEKMARAISIGAPLAISVTEQSENR